MAPLQTLFRTFGLLAALALGGCSRSSAPATDPQTAATLAHPDLEPEPRTPVFAERSRALDHLGLTADELTRARRFQPLVASAARKYRIDPNLLNALIKHESRFNPRARNPSGAAGLMQLMPKTSRALAKKLGRPNRPTQPDFAIHAGALLVRTLLDMFNDKQDLALFGFAQGSGRVRAWQKRRGPYPPRIRRFISKIKADQAAFRRLGFPGQ